MEFDKIYKQADNIITRKVLDETLLVPISGEIASMDELYSLNDTGAFIWQVLDGNRTLADIVRELEREYDVSPEETEADLVEIITELIDTGLVKSVS